MGKSLASGKSICNECGSSVRPLKGLIETVVRWNCLLVGGGDVLGVEHVIGKGGIVGLGGVEAVLHTEDPGCLHLALVSFKFIFSSIYSFSFLSSYSVSIIVSFL